MQTLLPMLVRLQVSAEVQWSATDHNIRQIVMTEKLPKFSQKQCPPFDGLDRETWQQGVSRAIKVPTGAADTGHCCKIQRWDVKHSVPHWRLQHWYLQCLEQLQYFRMSIILLRAEQETCMIRVIKNRERIGRIKDFRILEEEVDVVQD